MKPSVMPGERRSSRIAMPVIVKNIPAGYDWGWYSREDPRMHLQVVDQKHESLRYKVWLEKRGKRIFEEVASIPPKILKALKTEVQKNRDIIEHKWARFLIQKGWIQAFLEGDRIKLVVYPQTEKRIRYVPLLRSAEHPTQHLTPENVAQLKQEDFRLNDELASIEFWPHLPPMDRHDIELAPYIWQD